MQPRCGKTFSTVLYLLKNFYEKVLILCPKPIVDVWASELEECNIPYTLATHSVKKKKLQQVENSLQVCITNIESVKTLDILEKYSWDVRILDESIRIANIYSGSELPRRFFMDRVLYNKEARNIVLSGAPATEGNWQLANQMIWAFGEWFGCKDPYEYIQKYWMYDEETRRLSTTTQHEKNIKKELHSKCFVLSQRKAGIRVNKLYRVLGYNLISSPVNRVLDDLLQPGLKYKNKKGVTMRLNPMTHATFLKMLSVGIDYKGEVVEKEHYKKICDFLMEHRPCQAVILCCYRKEVKEHVKCLRDSGLSVESITGSTDGWDSIIKKYLAGGADVVVAQIDTVKMGLDFSSSDFLIYSSPPFKGDDRVQADERATNLKRKTPVEIIDFCARIKYGRDTIRFAEYVRKKVIEKKNFSAEMMEQYYISRKVVSIDDEAPVGYRSRTDSKDRRTMPDV